MRVKEIICKRILTKSRLPEGDYVLNPYVGCQHGCVYCYARFIKRFTGHTEPWGQFVDVKVNAVEALKEEITRAKRGCVILSSISDPYQPLEKKYKLTRGLLKVLLEHQWPIAILTKSDLVLRDVDLLKKFKDCEVGLTITFLDDKDRKKFEPHAAPISKRFEALRILHKNRIKTYGFIGPIFPYITDIPKLFVKVANMHVNRIFMEVLNTSAPNWAGVNKILKKSYPGLLPKYREIFFTKNDYHTKLRREVVKLAKKHGVKCDFYFPHLVKK